MTSRGGNLRPVAVRIAPSMADPFKRSQAACRKYLKSHPDE